MDDLQGSAVRQGLPFPGALTVLALVTVVLARGLAHALPGAFAGTDDVIRWVGLGSDYASQLCALTFAVLGVRMLLLELLSSREVWLKVLAAACTLATVSAVYVSTDAAYRPHPIWLVVMGASLSVLALSACARALSVARLRGIALVIGCVALAGAGHLVSRWLLVDTEPKMAVRIFATARVIATLAFGAEVAALGLALAWLATGVPRTDGRVRTRLGQAHWLWSLGALAIALATALVLAQGQEGWRLLLARTLAAFGTHPDPLVPGLALNLMDLLVLAVCLGSLLPWSRPASDRAALSFVLLGRSSFDVPLAGLLVLVALLTVVAELPVPTLPIRPRDAHLGPRAELRR